MGCVCVQVDGKNCRYFRYRRHILTHFSNPYRPKKRMCVHVARPVYVPIPVREDGQGMILIPQIDRPRRRDSCTGLAGTVAS